MAPAEQSSDAYFLGMQHMYNVSTCACCDGKANPPFLDMLSLAIFLELVGSQSMHEPLLAFWKGCLRTR